MRKTNVINTLLKKTGYFFNTKKDANVFLSILLMFQKVHNSWCSNQNYEIQMKAL